MEHRPLVDLAGVADVKPAPGETILTRVERLERWAELLDREPRRSLRSLVEIEWAPRHERADIRTDDSPLSVAFADPVLRAAGLAGDRLGDGMGFFELNDAEAHRVLCSCLNGHRMEAGTAARRVRSLMAVTPAGASLWGVVGLIAGAPVLMYLLR